MEGEEGEHGEEIDPVRGLAATENGFTLEIADPERALKQTEPLRFRIVDGDGAPVRDFDVEHTKRMHLIVVRRDLTGFQHLHPRMAARRHLGGAAAADRARRVPRLRRLLERRRGDDAGRRPARSPATPPRRRCPRPSRPPSATAATTSASPRAPPPRASRPTSSSRSRSDGEPVEVEPYLGADGHLVALREGDLAFLHVHPITDEASAPGEIAFEATFPTAGSYRLFLQFQVDGEVETVAFTQEVE